jgi:tRNA(Ile)-lysidine synthase
MFDALNPPIGEGEFALLMEGFAPFPKKIALAVSGGADSMALAFCAKRWNRDACVALIVEHGLRDESADEAVQVKKRLAALGIPAEILPWKHGDVTARHHEKAREARYGLLTETCHRLGAEDLLIAHHRSDQAETILMRLAKGSGIDGLAGMAPQTTRDGIRLLRPFLALSKERLVATCAKAGIPTVADPSNLSEKYARGRLRKIMPLLAAEGLTVESLATLGQRAREAKDALDRVTQEFLKTTAQIEAGGVVCLDRAALRAAPRDIARRALAASLRFVHDDAYPPEHAALSGLLDAIAGGDGAGARTLYGCLASIAEKRVILLREPSAASEVLPLSAGVPVLWDKRWVVTAESLSFPATVRALGFPPHDDIDALAPRLRHKIPQGRVRASLPAIWEGEKLRALPSFDEKAPFRMVFGKRIFP